MVTYAEAPLVTYKIPAVGSRYFYTLPPTRMLGVTRVEKPALVISYEMHKLW